VAEQGQETFKNAVSSALRALSRHKELDVQFRAGMRHGDTSARPPVLTLPDPGNAAKPGTQDAELLRASADIKALRLLAHNPGTHNALAPEDPQARNALEAMERARYEMAGSVHMDGVRANLDALLDAHCLACGHDKAQEQSDIPAGDALYALTKTLLGGAALPQSARALHDLWWPAMRDHLDEHNLAALRHNLHDQAAFARIAAQCLRRMGYDVQLKETDNRSSPGESEGDQAEGGPDDSPENAPATDDSADGAAQDTGGDQQAFMDSAAEFEDLDEDGTSPGAAPAAENTDGQSESEGSAAPQGLHDHSNADEGLYKVFTSQFDETVHASELADHEELYKLRAQLDTQLTHIQGIVTRLANKLQRQLMAKQNRSWAFDQEEGTLDTARLSRIIANPNIPLTYKRETETEFRDTVVTLLIDNSGSMRGRPITIAALCTDILARTLERCGVSVEILGFTTSAWKGGKSRELWFEQGRPPRPGRLNDLRHIIYKAADAPWRKTRKNLGLMLKEGILKENIDGEALAWAHNRLTARPEQRKILMVISDGAPVDDSTLSVNPSNILEADLREIITWIEDKTDIELAAIGIGHDVTRYYSRAITITDAESLGAALTEQMTDLLRLEEKKTRAR
jgi:cobaltochelatase CobT